MEQDNNGFIKSVAKKLWQAIKLFFVAFVNVRFAFCFFLSWMITNGWAYVACGAALLFDMPWLATACGAYLGFLWLPFICEKFVQIPIAIYLSKLLFPNDNKTVESLRAVKDALIASKNEKKKARLAKKQAKLDASSGD